MYTPPYFAETDLARLHDAIERYSFAVLVSGAGEEDGSGEGVGSLSRAETSQDGPTTSAKDSRPPGRAGDLVASHLPLLIDRSAGPKGTLLGHLARANSQWEQAAGSPVLAIFSGPHAYISPTWYATEHTVPTWNYVAVHVYGTLQLIEEQAQTLALLQRTVAHYEAALPKPWQLAEQPTEFIERLAEQIVAFRIPIERIEGKWKLNQNHPQERRERVIAELQKLDRDDAQEIARLMEDRP